LADIGILSASQHPTNRPIPVPPKRTYIQPGQKLELDLTPAERKAILDHLTLLPPEYEAQLRKVHPEQPLLLTLDDLEDFSGYVAAEANHTSNKKLRKVLDTAFEKMTDLLDRFTDEEPPVKKTTKKAQAAEREEAERQKQILTRPHFSPHGPRGFCRQLGSREPRAGCWRHSYPGNLRSRCSSRWKT
jgi:hypothetical protein